MHSDDQSWDWEDDGHDVGGGGRELGALSSVSSAQAAIWVCGQCCITWRVRGWYDSGGIGDDIGVVEDIMTTRQTDMHMAIPVPPVLLR